MPNTPHHSRLQHQATHYGVTQYSHILIATPTSYHLLQQLPMKLTIKLEKTIFTHTAPVTTTQHKSSLCSQKSLRSFFIFCCFHFWILSNWDLVILNKRWKSSSLRCC